MTQTMIVPLDLFSNSAFKIISSLKQHERMVSKKRGKTSNEILRTICQVSLKYFNENRSRLGVKHRVGVSVAILLYVK
jgi:hypothetical protein